MKVLKQTAIFADLAGGDIFTYNGIVYMKVYQSVPDSPSIHFAANVDSGLLLAMRDDTVVRPKFDSELVVK